MRFVSKCIDGLPCCLFVTNYRSTYHHIPEHSNFHRTNTVMAERVTLHAQSPNGYRDGCASLAASLNSVTKLTYFSCLLLDKM